MPYTRQFDRIRIENIVIARQDIFGAEGNPVGWYPKPTVNFSLRTEQGQILGMSISFLNDGKVLVNGLQESGIGLTPGQFDRLKQDAKALYNAAKSVLGADLIDEEDME